MRSYDEQLGRINSKIDEETELIKRLDEELRQLQNQRVKAEKEIKLLNQANKKTEV